LSTVRGVGFSNGTENLGLGKVAATREQDVPAVPDVEELEGEEHHKEHDGHGAQRSEHQQPRLVSETGGHESDDDAEDRNEQEGLQTGGVKHQVQGGVSVERQPHHENDSQHGQEHHGDGRRVATAEHVEGHLQGISKEQDGGTHNEPFPTKRGDPEGHTGQHGVRKRVRSLSGDVTVGGHEGGRVGRRHAADASGACVADGAHPEHEAQRDEQHHKGVVVGQGPSRVGDVSRHEGDEPSGEHRCALTELVVGHGSDREHRESAIDGGKSQHAEPNGVSRVGEEGFQEHGPDGHRPRKQGRSRVDTAERVGAVCVNQQVGVVGENVVDNTLHVPRVGTPGHVPVAGAKGVHRGHGVPLNADGETDEEGSSDHHSRTVRAEEHACVRWLMLAAVGPATVALVITDVVNGNADEEGEAEP